MLAHVTAPTYVHLNTMNAILMTILNDTKNNHATRSGVSSFSVLSIIFLCLDRSLSPTT